MSTMFILREEGEGVLEDDDDGGVDVSQVTMIFRAFCVPIHL